MDRPISCCDGPHEAASRRATRIDGSWADCSGSCGRRPGIGPWTRRRPSRGAPSSRQTIYAYERGGLTPSLAQFLDLVEFYVLRAPHPDGAKADEDLRAQGVAAVDAGPDAAPVPRGRRPRPRSRGCSPALGGSGDRRDRPRRDRGRRPGRRRGALPADARRRAGPSGAGGGSRASRRSCSRWGPRSSSCSARSAPTPPSGPFLAKRGPGVHHVAYRVDDVAAALAHLRDEGARLVDEAPRRGSRDTLIAFVHPKDMGGVLVELVQLP